MITVEAIGEIFAAEFATSAGENGEVVALSAREISTHTNTLAWTSSFGAKHDWCLVALGRV
jgi:hypothetical protein